MSATSSRINRILLVRTDRLGDVILTLPLLPVLRKHFPDSHIAMLLRRYTGEIMEGNPYVDELIWYDDVDGLIPFGAMRKTLHNKKFDAVIVVYPTLRLAWLMFRSRIPARIGTGYRYYSFLFTKRVFEHRKDAKRHELEYNFTLLKELGCPDNGPPEFYIDIPVEAERNVRQLLESLRIDPRKDLIILHPGTGGSAREWSVENFGRLGTKLIARNDVQVVVSGGRGEGEKVSGVLREMGNKAVGIVDRMNLKELAALIRLARLFVSNSTGPLHLAAAVGTPVVGLFPQASAMSPRRWGPYTNLKKVIVPPAPHDCRKCSGKSEEPCSCMASITVDEVYEASQTLLAEGQMMRKGTLAHG